MKIYIDGLFYKQSGIGRYYSNLIKLLAENKFEIFTCVPQKLKNTWLGEFEKYQNISPIFVDYEKFALFHSRSRSAILKELEKDCQVFWFPHVNLPLSYVPKNAIVTVHDLRMLTKWWDRTWLKREVLLRLVKRAISKSKLIVTPSNFSRGEIVKHFPEAEGKVLVLYNFIEDKFTEQCLQKAEPIVREKYILFVGNRKKHKNLKNLVIAYSKIKDYINCKLVIAGARDKNKRKDELDRLAEDLNIKQYIKEFVFPSDDVIMNLYQHAELFVFPSFYEGFGYPPLEAMACGCPVLASNIPVLKEILGEEIACLDPYSPDDMALKIREVLEKNSTMEHISKIGGNVVKKYSKPMLSSHYLAILENFKDENGCDK